MVFVTILCRDHYLVSTPHWNGNLSCVEQYTLYIVRFTVYKRKLNISMCVVWVFYHVLVEHFWYKHKVLDEKHKCEKHWICSNAVLECHDCCADSAQTHVNLLLSKYFVFYDSSSESADKCLWSNTTTWKQPCLENILMFEHPFVSLCFLWHLYLHKYRESFIWSPRRPPAVLLQHQVFAAGMDGAGRPSLVCGLWEDWLQIGNSGTHWMLHDSLKVR